MAGPFVDERFRETPKQIVGAKDKTVSVTALSARTVDAPGSDAKRWPLHAAQALGVNDAVSEIMHHQQRGFDTITDLETFITAVKPPDVRQPAHVAIDVHAV